MKLLITGGSGFLGSNLAAEGLRQGHEVIVFDNLSRTGSAENLGWLRQLGDLHFVHGDIRNANDVQRVVAAFAPEAIFHLAGQVAMTTSLADPRQDFETNAAGTFHLLEAVRQLAPAAVVLYSSTNKVYGNLEQFSYAEEETRYRCVEMPRGFDESVTLDFHSPYGCSKGSADQYVLDYARIYGLKTAVFRHSSMYGSRQFATSDQGWIGWFCQQAMAQKQGIATEPFTISGSGKQVRDVLHADDMSRLYFAAVARIEQARGLAFNVGGGMANSLSLLELLALLEELLDVRLAYRRLPSRPHDQRVFVADTALAQRTLGWSPRVGAREGIAAMLEWVSSWAA